MLLPAMIAAVFTNVPTMFVFGCNIRKKERITQASSENNFQKNPECSINVFMHNFLLHPVCFLGNVNK
jgi:hypothetical protein